MVLVEWDQQQPRLFDAKICSSFFQYCDQYSTCTNVNTFFFQVPGLEFGHATHA